MLLVAPLLALVLLAGSISDYASLNQSSPRSAVVDATEDLLFLGFAKSVSGSIQDEQLSEVDQARKLVMWTHLNIRTQNTSPGLVISDGALNVVRRGYGYCDQSAQILASIAWALGWESRMWFLRDENGVSPHAVAEINWGDGWVLADPWLGLLGVDDTGRQVSVQELGEGGAAYESSGYAAAGFAPEHFRNAEEIMRLPYTLQQGPLTSGLLWMAEAAYRGVGRVIEARDIVASRSARGLGVSDPSLGVVWPAVEDISRGGSPVGGGALGLDPNHASYLAALSHVLAGDFGAANAGIDRALVVNPDTPWRASLEYLRYLISPPLPDDGPTAGNEESQVPVEAQIRREGKSNLNVGVESLVSSR